MNIEFLTIRTIFENDNAKISDIAYLFSVDEKLVSDAIDKAILDGYVEKKGNFCITKKGLEYLSQYKVDNAIIFACGKGMRLAPLTFDTPKCFIRIKGQKMIERQIEQILAAGIKDITVMTGFMKEKFDYLIHKYGVNIIYNEEYDNKNTLATFHHALDKIKNHNCYICVSDVYMVNNIYHAYECENYYCGTFLHDLDKEWQYVRDENNKITGVLDGGVDEYAMMGPSFLKKDFSDELIPLIEEAYNKQGTENYYWENVLVDNFDKLPDMYLYKQIKNSMYEFDKLEDVRLFDEDIKTGSFSFSFVADTFSIQEKDIKDIECIKAGITNRSYIFSIGDNKKYICRVPGLGTNYFIDRKNEKKVYEFLKNENMTENVIAFDDDGVKISEFFINAKTMDIDKEKELRDAMLLFRKFHNLNIKVDRSCDLEDKNNEYIKVIEKSNIDTNSFPNYKNDLLKLQKLNDFKNSKNRIKTLIHGDANPGNVLYTKDGIKLIDFEYAGMADPLVDVALFGIYCEFSIEKTLSLLDLYNSDTKGTIFEGEKIENIASSNDLNDELIQNLLVCYMALGAFWCVVWVICRDGLAKTDNSIYGNKMYKIFNDCYDYLDERKLL